LPKRLKNFADRAYKRQFKLMNRVGQLGRQGIKGPVEQSEKRILSPISKKKK